LKRIKLIKPQGVNQALCQQPDGLFSAAKFALMLKKLQ
jgi:hypothetical protein